MATEEEKTSMSETTTDNEPRQCACPANSGDCFNEAPPGSDLCAACQVRPICVAARLPAPTKDPR